MYAENKATSVKINVPATSASTILTRLRGNLVSNFLRGELVLTGLTAVDLTSGFFVSALLVTRVTVVFDVAAAAVVFFELDFAVAAFLVVFFVAIVPPYCTITIIITYLV